MDVTFPDGTKIRAAPLRERLETDDARDFGLYMDERWSPTWPAELIDWADFGLPTDRARAATQIREAWARARAGERVEVGCLGGLGRTGTVLACMATLSGVPAGEAVAWVRRNYDVRAVETADQEAWVTWFAEDAAAD